MQIVRNLDIGGGQEVVRTLAENLNLIGCSVIVCSFKDGPLRREIEDLGIQVVLLPDRNHSILAFPFFIKEMSHIRNSLSELVDRYNINVVQTHLLRILNFPTISLMAMHPDLLVYWTFHNTRFTLRKDHLRSHKWMLKPKKWFYKWLDLYASTRVSGFIAVSSEVKQAMVQDIGSIGDKITVVPNGVDVRRYLPDADKRKQRKKLGLDSEARIISVVATFKEQKGHRYLIEAVPSLKNRFPDLLILLIGDGELKQELENLTNQSDLSDTIKFLGARGDIPDLLSASDLFVLPSLWEGLPMALVEAMASGLPIVATEVSGSKQAILPGKTGLLVEPGNALELEKAIAQMLDEPELGRQMGAAARLRADEDFSAERQARDHLKLYQADMIKQAGSRLNGK